MGIGNQKRTFVRRIHIYSCCSKDRKYCTVLCITLALCEWVGGVGIPPTVTASWGSNCFGCQD